MKFLFFFLLCILNGCGGSTDSINIPAIIDLKLSCKYIGENRFAPSLDVFCSRKDFEEVYPNTSYKDAFYFKSNNRDVLIASFIGSSFVDQSERINSKDDLRTFFYRLLGGQGYSARSEKLKNLNESCSPGSEVFTVETRYTGLQRLYEYCTNHPRKGNLAVIYLEGHGGGALDIGINHMDFLASQGYRVFYSDMPLVGSNSNNVTISHNDLGGYEQGGGIVSPILTEFIYPVGKFIEYLSDDSVGYSVALFGRSGGGWRSYVAGALYDVDYVISIAGGTPHSMRLSAPWTVYELGDWEQWSPTLYSIIGHEDFMRFSGRKGSAYVYNLNDTCCFRLNSSDPFFQWLKRIRSPFISVYVDETNFDHSLGSDGMLFLTNTFKEWGI